MKICPVFKDMMYEGEVYAQPTKGDHNSSPQACCAQVT